MTLKKIDKSNDLFEVILEDWEDQCKGYGEDILDYALPSLSHARKIINEDINSDYSIYGCYQAGKCDCLIHVNCALLPKTQGYTLKFMWILLAPKFDFEDVDADLLAVVSSQIVEGAVSLCKADSRSRHVKIHLSNMGDRRFFLGVAFGLKSSAQIESADVKGNWLQMTLA